MTAAEGGYKRVSSKNDLKEGGLARVDLDGKPIVLAMVSGKIYAMDAVCSHEGGPLEDGTLQGYELKCPWHYAVFDVRNAKVSDQTVWATDLQPYSVKVDESTGDIFVSSQENPAAQEATVQQTRDKQDSDASEKKYYEEEERNADDRLSLELISKEPLQGTDIMTFKFGREDMDFSPGQYAFFKLDGVSADDSKGPVRHFSIASSPTEQDYVLISTRIRDTPYKQKLASLRAGPAITAWGPEGKFVLHDDYSKPAVLLSGGIGVTPFRSMIKYATDKSLPIRITLFDSNRNKQSILYREEFDSWARQNKKLKIVYTVTEEQEGNEGWRGERTRIDRSMLEKYLSKDEIGNAIFYVCGPPGMLKAMQDLLQKDLQIPNERLRVEAFTGY